ncbi:sodium/glutamate symporter [Peptoniphilus indolicus]|uniref:ESS family glutamate:Na+ symporter n=2 Tax=Peptoniphilus indolicus TaxID=33030 RepID=G4D3T2_9FIRM|nr:sodium/glutamate symporter [Peptoniphilus indolicus]EGY79817.1 ESS family glutamate:Na+ symporter [Peptoniphilus indolicus ATCC 29427]SUB75755.1 Glutamate permease [Peptoniphilus indolicus]
MERTVVELGMFETLFLAVIGIYLGDFLRAKFPALKKYCIPSAVVGGTTIAIITMILYYANILEPNFDFKTVNTLFYCIFFAASGTAASMALLKKGGKLVVIFAILAAVLSAGQNAVALGVGSILKVNPLISMMTGSIPMTGGHGNAASFAPIAVEAGQSAAMEVAIASATFGLIAGSMLGGPFGNFLVKKYHFEDPELDNNSRTLTDTVSDILFNKKTVMSAVYMLMVACGIGQVIFLILKYFGQNFPIHVCCMFGGIMVRLFLDKTNRVNDSILEALDTVGEFSLGLFVSMSIVTMKLWQLAGLGGQLVVLLIAQVVFILLFVYLLTFRLLGKNYDSAVMAVGHLGFGTGAVPVSMTTMKTVCDKYRYSKIAFFVVPVIGGFISNITNAIIITKFLDIALKLNAGM